MLGSAILRKLFISLLLVALALAVPIIPFVLLGDGFETRVESWLRAGMGYWPSFGLVAGLLAIDLVLPIPSSVVSTFAGKQLGFLGATAASWLGMTACCLIGFGLARAWGRPLAARLAGEAELRRMDYLAARFGVWILVVVRAVPVLAEASIVLFGATRVEWRPFLLAVGLSNLGIAAAYAMLGAMVSLPIALAAAMVLPLTATVVAKRIWKPIQS